MLGGANGVSYPRPIVLLDTDSLTYMESCVLEAVVQVPSHIVSELTVEDKRKVDRLLPMAMCFIAAYREDSSVTFDAAQAKYADYQIRVTMNGAERIIRPDVRVAPTDVELAALPVVIDVESLTQDEIRQAVEGACGIGLAELGANDAAKAEQIRQAAIQMPEMLRWVIACRDNGDVALSEMGVLYALRELIMITGDEVRLLRGSGGTS